LKDKQFHWYSGIAPMVLVFGVATAAGLLVNRRCKKSIYVGTSEPRHIV